MGDSSKGFSPFHTPVKRVQLVRLLSLHPYPKHRLRRVCRIGTKNIACGEFNIAYGKFNIAYGK